MKEITTVGLDLAKNVFHVVASDARGVELNRKCLRRGQVLEYFARLPQCTVGMEACGGAHWWARQLEGLGHEVRLMAPRHVKAYVRGQKNDYNDARAIAEAVRVAGMRFVTVKSVEQQELQALHRLREGQVKARTQWSNRLRGLLGEHGIVVAKGLGALRRRLPEVLEDAQNGLGERMRALLARGYEQLRALDEQVAMWDREVEAASRADERCRRLQEIPGYGPVVASAYAGVMGDGSGYRNGREASAGLGLVPRQHSTGGKPVLLGITKRGDRYVRSLLVHGARAVVSRAAGKDDRLSRWIQRIERARGRNRATVALANKMARIGWAVLARGETYRPEWLVDEVR